MCISCVKYMLFRTCRFFLSVAKLLDNTVAGQLPRCYNQSQPRPQLNELSPENRAAKAGISAVSSTRGYNPLSLRAT